MLGVGYELYLESTKTPRSEAAFALEQIAVGLEYSSRYATNVAVFGNNQAYVPSSPEVLEGYRVGAQKGAAVIRAGMAEQASGEHALRGTSAPLRDVTICPSRV